MNQSILPGIYCEDAYEVGLENLPFATDNLNQSILPGIYYEEDVAEKIKDVINDTVGNLEIKNLVNNTVGNLEITIQIFTYLTLAVLLINLSSWRNFSKFLKFAKYSIYLNIFLGPLYVLILFNFVNYFNIAFTDNLKLKKINFSLFFEVLFIYYKLVIAVYCVIFWVEFFILKKIK